MNYEKYLSVLICLIAISLSGCAVHYKDLSYRDQAFIKESPIEKLTYRIKDLPVFASNDGLQAIEDALTNSKISASSEEYYGKDVYDEGFYVFVEPLYKPPGAPATVFGYISVSTLTLLPAWSNEDGYRIRYSVYQDGEIVKTFQYDRERFLALWLLVLPFAWVNLFTTSEYDAFYSATNEFLTDLQPILDKP